MKQLIPAINTIVVGDVGSGKTAVAITVGVGYLLGLERGVVTLMAPTEVLAVQHYESLLKYIRNLGSTDIDVVLVTQSNRSINGEKTTPKKMEGYLTELSLKKVFIIGTQALLHKNINADLVLIDEQHRFGVEQRGKLAQNKDGVTAHFISFSATPIPRTLAMTVYRHLDIVRLEKLNDRNPIKTIQLSSSRKEVIQVHIQEHCKAGGKVYIVVPQVEEGDDAEFTLKTTEKWVQTFAPANSIVVTHGKEKTKTEKLKQFKEDQDVKICIATTVVEVGVDVEEATLMVVLNAEKFGLAALHQLRGRIGRNSRQDNLCILVSTYPTSRLNVLESTNDGFMIAEKDLALRGSGSMLGKLQSGTDEITETLIALPVEDFQTLSDVVESIRFDDPKFARLKNYVERSVERVWKE